MINIFDSIRLSNNSAKYLDTGVSSILVAVCIAGIGEHVQLFCCWWIFRQWHKVIGETGKLLRIRTPNCCFTVSRGCFFIVLVFVVLTAPTHWQISVPTWSHNTHLGRHHLAMGTWDRFACKFAGIITFSDLTHTFEHRHNILTLYCLVATHFLSFNWVDLACPRPYIVWRLVEARGL